MVNLVLWSQLVSEVSAKIVAREKPVNLVSVFFLNVKEHIEMMQDRCVCNREHAARTFLKQLYERSRGRKTQTVTLDVYFWSLLLGMIIASWYDTLREHCGVNIHSRSMTMVAYNLMRFARHCSEEMGQWFVEAVTVVCLAETAKLLWVVVGANWNVFLSNCDSIRRKVWQAGTDCGTAVKNHLFHVWRVTCHGIASLRVEFWKTTCRGVTCMRSEERLRKRSQKPLQDVVDVAGAATQFLDFRMCSDESRTLNGASCGSKVDSVGEEFDGMGNFSAEFWRMFDRETMSFRMTRDSNNTVLVGKVSEEERADAITRQLVQIKDSDTLVTAAETLGTEETASLGSNVTSENISGHPNARWSTVVNGTRYVGRWRPGSSEVCGVACSVSPGTMSPGQARRERNRRLLKEHQELQQRVVKVRGLKHSSSNRRSTSRPQAIKEEDVLELKRRGSGVERSSCSSDDKSQQEVEEYSERLKICRLVLRERTLVSRRVRRFRKPVRKSARGTRLSDKDLSGSWCRALWTSVIIIACYSCSAFRFSVFRSNRRYKPGG